MLIVLLARRVRSSVYILVVGVFMALPLQFRYALEGRPYSQALFFSLLATLLLFPLLERVTPARTAAYAFAVLAGLYSQPLSLFVPLSHLLWTVCCFQVRTACESGTRWSLLLRSQ